jgi:3-isopropylmalate dehydrogenase
MMLKYSFNMEEESRAIEDAVLKVLEEGFMTLDIATENAKIIGCDEMGDAVASKI